MHLTEIDQNMILEPGAPLRASIEEEPLNELAESIRQIGLLQPIVVRESGQKFEVIAGHRRLLASRIVGLPRVPCLVVDSGSDDDVIAARLHENVFRSDISPVEEAALYAELFERLLDVDLVAKLVKRSRAVVENRLNLLSGDREVLKTLQAGMISAGVAEQLNRVKHESTRRYLLEYAVRDGASIEKVRNWRLQYADIDIGSNAPQTEPITAPVPVDVNDGAAECYLCGRKDDQHEITWVPMHSSCKRWAERQAENQNPGQEVAGGHQQHGD